MTFNFQNSADIPQTARTKHAIVRFQPTRGPCVHNKITFVPQRNCFPSLPWSTRFSGIVRTPEVVSDLVCKSNVRNSRRNSVTVVFYRDYTGVHGFRAGTWDSS